MAIFRPGRRRQYIIDRKFQFSYLITWLAMTVFFIVLIIGGLMYALSKVGESETYGMSELSFIFKANALFIIFITIAMALYLLLLSHRVAGPAFRLEKSIQQMLKGDYDFSIRLRKKDYLKQVANDLNNLLTVLRENRGTLNAIAEDVKALNNLVMQDPTSAKVKTLSQKIDQEISILLTQKKEDVPSEK